MSAVYLGLIATWMSVIASVAGEDIEDEAVVESISVATALFGLTSHFAATWYFNAIGRSLGKTVMGVHVVAPDGDRPGPSRGLGRTIGAYLSLLLLGLGYVWPAFDGLGQSWHDKVGDTFVVRDALRPLQRAPYG